MPGIARKKASGMSSLVFTCTVRQGSELQGWHRTQCLERKGTFFPDGSRLLDDRAEPLRVAPTAFAVLPVPTARPGDDVLAGGIGAHGRTDLVAGFVGIDADLPAERITRARIPLGEDIEVDAAVYRGAVPCHDKVPLSIGRHRGDGYIEPA